MDKELKWLIKAKRIQVKLGQLYCTTDDYGNIVWCIEQKPIIKG
ncbi:MULTISPECIES: hypothetical protein [Bacteroides]|nr:MULTISPECIES: hypothetical protein [Bacteroides]